MIWKVGKRKRFKCNFLITQNRQSNSKIWFAVINYSHMCDLCAKGFFDYEFNSADIDKISNFNEIASNFTYLWTSKFIKYNLTDTDHLLLISKFYGRGKSGMYFCIFGSRQPLTLILPRLCCCCYCCCCCCCYTVYQGGGYQPTVNL